MRNLLYKFPIHTFLICLFVSLFLYGNNVELVEIHMIYRTVGIGLLLSLIIFMISLAFLKEKIKAGIITSFIILSLFHYGVIYDFLEGLYYQGLWPLKSIHRYLVCLFILFIVAIIWFIKRKKTDNFRINYFFNLLILFLVLYNSILILVKKNNSTSKIIVAEKYTGNFLKSKTGKKLPNIYYMILDGYANSNILKDHYKFDNSNFMDYLSGNHFYVADSAFSNYYNTSQSLGATLNMQYHNNSDNSSYDKLRNNTLLLELKKYGYKTYSLQSGYAITSGLANIDSVITINSPNEFERSILKYTICRLDDIFGFIPFSRLKSQIEKLDDIESLKNVSPKFVFIHIVAPHPPFVFNEKGERSFTRKDNDNSWEPKEKYIQQLKYINSITKNFINNIIKVDSESVFILQSDHGPFITSNKAEDVFKARSMILNAIRYPQKDSCSDLYRNISSINTFRWVFKNYIDTTYGLIPDIKAGEKDLKESPVFKSKIMK